MANLCILLVALLCCLSTFTPVSASRVLAREWGKNLTILDFFATSPTVCFHDTDCSKTHYCTADISGLLKPLFTCIPKPSEGQPCNRGPLSEFYEPTECLPGLYCPSKEQHFLDTRPPGPKCDPHSGPNTCPGDQVCSQRSQTCIPPDRCRKQGSLGASCNPSDVVPCAGDDLVCHFASKTCKPHLPKGAACQYSHECKANLKCHETSSTCQPLKSNGEPCDSYDCIGYCDFSSGKCAPRVAEGGKCMDFDQCAPAGKGIRERVVCNRPARNRNVGVCVRESRLIKKQGITCDPNADRCDARRGLACGWVSKERRYACLLGTYAKGYGYCVPDSPYSSCDPRSGQPTTCRRYEDRFDEFSPPEEERFFACHLRQEEVPRGSICSGAGAPKCPKHTSCRRPPGVKDRLYDFTGWCVRSATEGQSCKDKFKTVCKRPLQCVRGTCQNGLVTTGTQHEKMTHAGNSEDCSKLPCGPGLLCKKNSEPVPPGEPELICKLPVKVVKRGELCYDMARLVRECEKGSVCTTNRDGGGLLRCRKQ